ncbi:unnamed protein product [Paramecium pentaurelia]|uniref:FYVE-type domain-containing protein n=1 Tax=Paramecium pentaurelia TaxID=43138 RepID=A0A8S1XI98_9CILI|nr:unnamed protein product [Paramecium pentaurelia]
MDKQCSICNKEFSFIKQNKSKCKRCGLVVCLDCNKNEFKISSSMLKPLKKEKVCLQCKTDCLYMEEQLEQSELSWNKETELQIDLYQQSLNLEQYKQQIKNAKANENYKQNLEQIKSDLIKCFITQEMFNYSFQDWICHSTNKMKVNQIFDDIENLLVVFLYRNAEVGYSCELLQISIVLLTLMKDFAALQLLEQLYELMPNEYWPTSTQEPNIQTLVQDFQLAFKIDSTQISQIKKFMEFFSTPNTQSLFIKGLNFSCFHIIFLEFVQQMNFEVIQKYLIVVAKCCLKSFGQFGFDYKTIGKQILTKTDYKSITQIKTLLDQKLGNSQLTFSSPKGSMIRKRNSVCSIDNGSFIDTLPQIMTQQNSQREIKIEDNFIFNFQNEQNLQIIQLMKMIEQKKKELHELQIKNNALKNQTQNKKQISKQDHENYIKMIEKLSQEIQEELIQGLQLCDQK